MFRLVSLFGLVVLTVAAAALANQSQAATEEPTSAKDPTDGTRLLPAPVCPPDSRPTFHARFSLN